MDDIVENGSILEYFEEAEWTKPSKYREAVARTRQRSFRVGTHADGEWRSAKCEGNLKMSDKVGRCAMQGSSEGGAGLRNRNVADC